MIAIKIVIKDYFASDPETSIDFLFPIDKEQIESALEEIEKAKEHLLKQLKEVNRKNEWIS